MLNFPGGVFSDYYRWRDGVGAANVRRNTTPHPGLATSFHSFGTDEFLAFASTSGGEPMITVNMTTGTAAEAADWVRYVNSDGRRVTMWQLGNEPYVPGTAAAMTPEQYAVKFLEFAAAMRAADSGIHLGVALDENYSRRATVPWMDWTERVFAIAASQIDFACLHAGYAPVVVNDEGWDPRVVYQAMLGAPGLIERNLAEVSARLRRLAGRRIPIAMTEWGPLFSDRPDSRFLLHSRSLGSGLYTASVLAALIRSSDVEHASLFKFTDSYDFLGALGWGGNMWSGRSPYLAMKLFAQFFETNLVATQTNSPSFDAPSVGWVDATGPVPFLDVVSSISADGNTLSVLVVNKHLTSPIQTEVQLTRFLAAGGTVHALKGSGADANSGSPTTATMAIVAQAEVGPQRRWNMGGPQEVWVESSSLTASGQSFSYSFPPHSVTVLRISRSRS
jgi:alpha-N-arabinofuranosidase